MSSSDGEQTRAGAGAAAGAAQVQVRVRDATREDMPLVRTMIQELAEYEGVPNGPKLSAEDLAADGFDAEPAWFFAVIASVGEEAVGYALCNRAYSSWTRRALYVEDLYVRRAWRRRGTGAALLRHVCARALREDVWRVDWHVLESNEPALRFYERLGARDLRRTEGRAALRLDRAHIEAAAAGAGPLYRDRSDGDGAGAGAGDRFQ